MKIIRRIIILYFLIFNCSACPASKRSKEQGTNGNQNSQRQQLPPQPWTNKPPQLSTIATNLTTSIPFIPGRIKAIKIKTGPEGRKNGTLKIKICSGIRGCCKIPKLGRGILNAFKANHAQNFIATEIGKCDNFSLPTMKKITIQPHSYDLKTEEKRIIPISVVKKLIEGTHKENVVSKSWTGATLLFISHTV